MLSAEEEKFLQYWEQRREVYSSTKSKLVRGLPGASMFGLPVLLLLVCVYLFFPDWYMKISATSVQTFFVIITAILIFIVGFAFARMHFKWEMSEQAYLELKHKKKLQIHKLNNHE